MKIFAISDLHLSTLVEKPMDIFGDGWQNHFVKISEDWKNKVSDKDIVLLGGDISWGQTLDEAEPDYKLISELPGKKLVLKGNHDYYWSSLSKVRLRFPQFDFIQNNAYRIDSTSTLSQSTISADPYDNGVVIAGSRGWSIPNKNTPEEDVKIYKRELQRLELSLISAQKLRHEDDKLIALLHYPPFDADYCDTDVTKLLEKYNVNIVLYGHLHGKNARITPHMIKNGIEYILTSCDLINYKLIQICEI